MERVIKNLSVFSFSSLLFLILLCLYLTPVQAAKQSVLNFSLLVFNGKQRSAYLEQVKAFEREYPHIKVNMLALESEAYKSNIEAWLQKEKYSDVMYWFGGERLNWYIRQGWVLPINDVWQDYQWDDQITSSAKSAVQHGQKVYALPVHYYHWGIYYKKSLFEKYGLSAPKTWDEFIEVCKTLKANGIAPISLGSKNSWPLAGWFDYLNLRLNGLDFHMDLLQGRARYSDDRVRQVFRYWQELRDQDYFLEGHQDLSWRQALPFLYRDQAGMFLMGNFWTSQIPEKMRDDFRVIPFPQISANMPRYEEAPTNVLFIPSNAKNKKAAALFLDFMARSDVQARLNDQLGMLAPQNVVQQKMNDFQKAGVQILSQAKGVSQFYDRDSPKPIATGGMEQMARFMNEPVELGEILDSLDTLKHESAERHSGVQEPVIRKDKVGS